MSRIEVYGMLIGRRRDAANLEKEMAMSSTKVKLFRTAWVKAFEVGELVFECKTPQAAHVLRFGLYNSVQDVRKGTCKELSVKEAVEGCSVVRRGDRTIVLLRSLNDEDLAEFAAVIGVELGAVEKTKTEADAEVEKSGQSMFARMQKELAEKK